MSKPKRGKRDYATAGISADVKETIAEFIVELEAEGVKRSTILTALSRTRYSPDPRTLRRHLGAIKSSLPPFSNSKASGRPPTLSDDDWAIICGWILSRPKELDLEAVARWIATNFNKEVSHATISRYIDVMGLSFQLTGRRPSKSETPDDYAQGYLDFLLKLLEVDFFNYDPSLIICIDFVTNSYRLDRKRTIGMKGQKQVKLNESKPTYTDSFLVVSAMAAGLGLLPMLFSFNPVFDPDGEDYETVLEWLEELGLRPDQLVWEQSDKHYCKESQDQVAHWQAVNRKKLTGTRILHDEGGAFKFEGHYMLEEDTEGGEMLFVFPSDQHGELSVLDNKVNAVAKNKWRNTRKGEDFAYDSLLLLHFLQNVDQKSQTSMWKENFLLRKKSLTLEKVKAHLGKGKGKHVLRETKRERYLEAFAQWEQENSEEE
jgi:hypothetical protein